MAEVTATEMIQPLIIREITSADWEQFKSIRLRALDAEPEAFADDSARAKRNYTNEIWQEKIVSQNRRWLVAQNANGNFVGIVGAVLNDPELGLGVAMITNVYTDRDQRGQGLGRRLVSGMVDILSADPAINELRLEVTNSPAQAPAIALYRSLGFEVVEERKGVVHIESATYDELFMRKHLR